MNMSNVLFIWRVVDPRTDSPDPNGNRTMEREKILKCNERSDDYVTGILVSKGFTRGSQTIV